MGKLLVKPDEFKTSADKKKKDNWKVSRLGRVNSPEHILLFLSFFSDEHCISVKGEDTIFTTDRSIGQYFNVRFSER